MTTPEYIKHRQRQRRIDWPRRELRPWVIPLLLTALMLVVGLLTGLEVGR